MIGGVAASAAVRTWPFRIYSFPSEIQLAHWYDLPVNFDISLIPKTDVLGILPQFRTVAVFNDLKGTYLDPQTIEESWEFQRLKENIIHA